MLNKNLKLIVVTVLSIITTSQIAAASQLNFDTQGDITFSQDNIATTDAIVTNEKSWDKLIQNLNELEIPEKTQKQLIEKLKNGQNWNSFDGKSKPITSEPYVDSKGFHYIRHTYEDGSVTLMTDIENMSKTFYTQKGTRVRSDSRYHYYQGGMVEMKGGILSFGFRVDWREERGYGPFLEGYQNIMKAYGSYANNVNPLGEIIITRQPDNDLPWLQIKYKPYLGVTSHQNLYAKTDGVGRLVARDK